MEKDGKITGLKLITVVMGEIMALRGEIGILSSVVAESADDQLKSKLSDITNRNFEKFKKLEEIFKELINEENVQNRNNQKNDI